ncbi:TPA: hypothetical protein HA235_01305 [Candidatus Woesearchaeota archaeon]|nr:hypothetical protein [Candidatus Woesearchaeota archaeon]HIH31320.1 hypothetical protein [Candidatus Woesearchaeota archaeon]HIH55389.1 hypothetical protein [Candidatus Woesearchaeota archaeon]HIJ01581.1 hypothetical protein [Candidatus Woesearchaeota archaeon]HIJ14580.1 hypothetical protein [Candidatus Woesearchaeota archaeon]
MEIIKTIRDNNYEQVNHIKIEAGNYTHRQIETKDGKTYMRIKQRRLFEIDST